jgi:hypothetical protein
MVSHVKLFSHVTVLWCVCGTCHMPLIRRVLVQLIGFISSWVTHTHTHARTHARTLSLSLSHTHTLSLTHTHTLSLQTLHINLLFTDNSHSQSRTLNSLTQLKSITSTHTIICSPTMNLPCGKCSFQWFFNCCVIVEMHDVTADGITWPFSTHSCVIQVFIAVAWQQMRRGDVRQCVTHHGTAELGSAWRKHCFIYCCVIAEMCFDVTVLAWRKYTTLCLLAELGNLPVSTTSSLSFFHHQSCYIAGLLLTTLLLLLILLSSVRCAVPSWQCCSEGIHCT